LAQDTASPVWIISMFFKKKSSRLKSIADVQWFVLYAVPRVGSNYLTSLLNLSPNLICHYELFHKRNIYYGFGDKAMPDPSSSDISLKNRDRDPLFFLDDVRNRSLSYDCIGFNLFPGHSEKILDYSLKETFMKKVVLRRKDVLKNFISYKIAQKTGVWNSRKQKEHVDKKIIFDKKEFIDHVVANEAFYRSVESFLEVGKHEYFTLYYEQLLESDKCFYDLLEYLGASSDIQHNREKFKKQNPEPLSLLVENFDFMVASLKGTPYELC